MIDTKNKLAVALLLALSSTSAYSFDETSGYDPSTEETLQSLVSGAIYWTAKEPISYLGITKSHYLDKYKLAYTNFASNGGVYETDGFFPVGKFKMEPFKRDESTPCIVESIEILHSTEQEISIRISRTPNFTHRSSGICDDSEILDMKRF